MKIMVVFTVDQDTIKAAMAWDNKHNFTYVRDGEIADLIFAFVTNSHIKTIEVCEEIKE